MISPLPKLSIIARDPNNRGDLLTMLATDVFTSLGYENFLMNVAKAGRELDISGEHRFESTQFRAECKATKGTIGGAEINKFVGAVDAERRERPEKVIHGYFLSIGGYKHSALTQEQSFNPKRIILLGPQEIVQQLVKGGSIIDPQLAIELSARHCESNSVRGIIDSRLELVGSEQGWIWCVYVRHSRVRTHVCLVHADGTVLPLELCREIREVAEATKHELAKYELVNVSIPSVSRPGLSDAKEKYFDYINAEYDSITLEGLPADHEIGSQRFHLRDLFVELSLEDLPGSLETSVMTRGKSIAQNPDQERDYFTPAQVIASTKRIALLGMPGSGKTTLLKLLATHYANSDNRADSSQLPDREWLPILLRCRTLDISTNRSIIELISDIVIQAEMPELRASFQELVLHALRKGNVLLLVDGLDEIRDPSHRQAFVAQLQCFIGRYPNTNLVVTSRETGYRVVAGSIRSICKTFRVAPLSNESIVALTLAWHQHVVGASKAVEREAEALAASIISSDRVHRLATNPLMLTTLLLVRRWVGQLPRRRSVLYQKAIEVLLMTWNVESHEPIDQEEAVPQLAYVAFSMMRSGNTTISSKELARLFVEARQNLPEILSYTSLSAHQFLRRVEERSSLLTLSGVNVVDGALTDIYEFKHLTFQEYLAAVALAEGYLPKDVAEMKIADVLKLRFDDAAWREVISLTAVLSGRRASEVISVLIDHVESESSKLTEEQEGRPRNKVTPAIETLLACLEDEVSITPELAEKAIYSCFRRMSRTDRALPAHRLTRAVQGGRYSAQVKRIAYERISVFDPNMPIFAQCLSDLIFLEHGAQEQETDEDWSSYIMGQLRSHSPADAIGAALLFMRLCFTSAAKNADERIDQEWKEDQRNSYYDGMVTTTQYMVDRLIKKLTFEDPTSFAYIWALCWSPVTPKLSPDVVSMLRVKLLEGWQYSSDSNMQRWCAWLMWGLPLKGELQIEDSEAEELEYFIRSQSKVEDPTSQWDRRRAAYVVSYYTGLGWTEKKLAELVDIERKEHQRPSALPWRKDFLDELFELIRAKNSPGYRSG